MEKEDNWQGRATGMKCAACIHFIRKVGENIAIGRCRRHAPTMEGWPVVFTRDWCSDHKLDENYVG